jgi:hypothetical protein
MVSLSNRLMIYFAALMKGKRTNASTDTSKHTVVVES